MITSRRFDLDWLRIIAFVILIYFHGAIFFVPGGLPLIQNDQNSEALAIFIDISSQFRLALLFFISGVGVSFAKRHLSDTEFIKERSKRLLLPLTLGILFIVPPMVYTEKLFLGEFNASFWSFYPQFFTEGLYPKGNLSWHHFWFLAYLFIYCLLALWVLPWLERSKHAQTFITKSNGFGIYRFITILFIGEGSLRVFFPGFRDLIHDWASFMQWFAVFIAGFVFATNSDLLDTARKLRTHSALLLVACLALSYWQFGGINVMLDLDSPYIIVNYILYCLLRVTVTWTAILTCLGFAAKYLSFNHRYLSFLNQAVYPLFILHLTILTVLAYFMLELPWGLWPKYITLCTLTLLICLTSYRYLIYPFNFMRFLFGVKHK